MEIECSLSFSQVPTTVHFLNQMNPNRFPKYDFSKIHFNIILRSTPRPFQLSFLVSISNQNLHTLLIYSMLPTCTLHLLLLLDLIIIIIFGLFGEQYKL
jgi:hypothetical protein